MQDNGYWNARLSQDRPPPLHCHVPRAQNLDAVVLILDAEAAQVCSKYRCRKIRWYSSCIQLHNFHQYSERNGQQMAARHAEASGSIALSGTKLWLGIWEDCSLLIKSPKTTQLIGMVGSRTTIYLGTTALGFGYMNVACLYTLYVMPK